MAFPSHADGPMGTGRSHTRRPIVLTRIPRVISPAGFAAEPLAAAQDTVQQASASSPTLDDAISDRLPPQASEATYFVDRQHESGPRTSVEADERTASRRRRRLRTEHRESRAASPSKPQDWASRLYRMHAELAPYAGVIVTLALVASAGLLYWLMVGPSPAPTDDHYVFGSEVVGTASSELPEFAPRWTSSAVSSTQASSEQAVSTSPESSEPVEAMPWLNPGTVTTATPPSASLIAPQKVPRELLPLPPVAQGETLADGLSTGQSTELLFSTTSHREALDFAKIGVPAEGESTSFSPPKKMEPMAQGVPAVAQRWTSRPFAPVKR